MQSKLEYKVHYADTDAYGVVWHGTYLRWMEAGRVELLLNNGIHIDELSKNEGIVMPVVEVDIKYKHSAKLMDDIIVETNIKEITNVYVIFNQTVKTVKTNTICTTAEVKAVAVNKDGKIMRNIKELIGYKDKVLTCS